MSTSNIKLSIDSEIAADFRESFQDNYESVANSIVLLEENPKDLSSIDAVFRALHTIKGNTTMCQLDELASFSHAIEDVVSAMHEETLSFSAILGEMLLVALDKVKELSEVIFENKELDKNLLHTAKQQLNNIKSAKQADADKQANTVIALLTHDKVDDKHSVFVKAVQDQQTDTENDTLISYETPQELLASLNYFKYLISMLDSKLKYWQNRTTRTLPLALAINHELSDSVADHQLAAAVYMHDIAHAFLNDSLTLKIGKFDEADKTLIRTHPSISADLVALIPGWTECVTIIRQHHEHWDGSGYPTGIKGDDICIGAQILAIVDAYESMTHPRADRQFKRSVLRAVTEISNQSGKQFSPRVTKLAFKIIKQFIAAKP